MPHFDIQSEIQLLELKQPFTIARGTREKTRNVIVTLAADGIRGRGEAAPNSRYSEDAEKVLDFIDKLPDSFFDDLSTPLETAKKIQALEPPVKSAQAALEMAWLDWWGKFQDKPLWDLWTAPTNSTVPTSYTIGLDEIEVMQQKVEAAESYPILKVKLGTDRDRDIIRAIREVTDKTIRVDANEAWKSLEEAKSQIAFLADQHIELVEQPMPAAMKEEMREIKKWAPLQLFADESFEGDEDLDEIAEQFDGINIKLMKIGSLVKARKVIQQAKKRDLEIMVGCMIESSLAIAAGALIGTWADYVDLDGNLLISNDPYSGLSRNLQKQIILSDGPGLGVRPVD